MKRTIALLAVLVLLVSAVASPASAAGLVSPLGSVFFLRRRGQRACRPAGASFAAGRGRNSRPGDNRVSGFHPRR